ncbi:beta-ketoacyl synthase chain length factor [Terasakiella pusilla]|uniref:beta-ketoacyl synthase chain length factor n=1 Tax=Terasakiella pusilla TaxID=64973 RepID=UPI003AA9C3B2
MTLSFSVRDWAAWGPGLETLQAWEESDNLFEDLRAEDLAPPVKDLPMMLRRRLSRLGRMMMRVSHDVDPQDQAAVVFSSRYGESAQTVTLLQSLSLSEPLSPANFSMSVHNGLAGLLSIATKNTKPHTAISAGKGSFCAGLLEACALLSSGQEGRVLLVHCDEPLSDFYEGFTDPSVKPFALALVLEAKGKEALSLSVTSGQGQGPSCEDAALGFIEHVLKAHKAWSWCDGRTSWNINYVK